MLSVCGCIPPLAGESLSTDQEDGEVPPGPASLVAPSGISGMDRRMLCICFSVIQQGCEEELVASVLVQDMVRYGHPASIQQEPNLLRLTACQRKASLLVTFQGFLSYAQFLQCQHQETLPGHRGQIKPGFIYMLCRMCPWITTYNKLVF